MRRAEPEQNVRRRDRSDDADARTDERGELRRLNEKMIDALLVTATIRTRDERDGADEEAEHRDHQEKDHLERVAERVERVFLVWQSTAESGDDREHEDVQNVDADDRRGKRPDLCGSRTMLRSQGGQASTSVTIGELHETPAGELECSVVGGPYGCVGCVADADGIPR